MAKVLVIGSGGREDALCWKLAASVKHVYACPGNAGTLKEENVTNISLNIKDYECLISWCKENQIDLVVIGPEDPLAAGISDELNNAGIPCFGPSAKAAKIESSKEFAKEFMDKYNIPTARWKSFTDAKEACNHIQNCSYEALVVKASGLAAGKGVIVAETRDKACEAVYQIMENKSFGAAGQTVVIEEKLMGEEFSVIAFCDGQTSVCFPPAQDHKRLNNGDTGPNTGGMGAYCPCPQISEKELSDIHINIVQKAVDGMNKTGTPYKGILYAGIMKTKDGPKVLEFNCRFGDPETQVILPILKSDLYEVAKRCVDGTLGDIDVEFHQDLSAAAVVSVSGGYPGSYKKGMEISGINDISSKENCIIFHAGTALKDGKLVTSGGRVLATVCLSASLETALKNATNYAAEIYFDGRFYRTDIGRQALRSKQISLSYKDSGVDIAAGDNLVSAIKPFAKATSRPGCQVDLGMFGGLFDPKAAGYKDPILVSGTDGVGTKLKIAQICNMHDSIGVDLVAMCVNDILAHGAEPLFFLDYFACGNLKVETATNVIKGIADGCHLAGCALLGGETAEMPGMYKTGEYDLAGFSVGAVERENILPKLDAIKPGDVIIGVASSGIHSNGYSLVRKLVDLSCFDYSMPCPFSQGETLGQALLTPTKIYSKSILPVFRTGHVKAYAHITGGGLIENIPRILPNATGVRIDSSKWKIPPVFGWLSGLGNISDHEMAKTFNCGIGCVLIVSEQDSNNVLEMVLNVGEDAAIIGNVTHIHEGEPKVVIDDLETELAKIKTQFRVKPVVGVTNGVHIEKKKVAVLISGSGTNLQALIDYTQNPENHSKAEIAVVVSNVPGVKGLDRARQAGIPTKVINNKDFKKRLDFDMAIDAYLEECGIDVICLAGFMRILTGEFTRKWQGKLLNVHPSLLPAFKGAEAHKLVLEAGVRISGCSVHFVTEEVDAGAILVQESVPVYPKDTIETLQERIKAKEHIAFPKALEIVASGEAKFDAGQNKVVWSQ